MKKIDFKMGIVYTCCNISELYNLIGNYKKSIEYGEEAVRLSRELKILYVEEQAYLSLSVAYTKLRQSDRALDYFKTYSSLKDSLLNEEKQKQIAEMQVRYETETIEKQKQIAEQERELLKVKASKQQTWVRFMLLIIIIIAVFMVILLIQARVQRRLNNILVLKNREVVKSERQLYEKKKELEEVINSLKEKNSIGNDRCVEKYSQSSLQKTEEKKFLEKLERLMEEDKLFLNSDLTLDKLAKHLDSNRSYISQVINDNYKQNVSNFLNHYRIKEACYLLSDPKNQVKTIEGIAQEVGFNSITTFNRCFKKHTGVNPSFYIKAQS
jgi:YesN/AraC family two-component response regulator